MTDISRHFQTFQTFPDFAADSVWRFRRSGDGNAKHPFDLGAYIGIFPARLVGEQGGGGAASG
jgi:hypothetical protein